MTKKFLSVLLAVIMVLSMAPVVTFAEDDITDYLEYEINDDEVTITGYSYGTAQFGNHITIPDTIEGYPVTTIGSESSFGWVGSLTSVTIPASVTSVNYNAKWVWANMLTNITVAEENESYSSDDGVLFNKDKTELVLYPGGRNETEYTIPDFVTSIGEYAFYECTALTSVTIPNSVTSIGSNAFNWCTALTSVTIPDSVTSIGSQAFYFCTSLASVTIPDSVVSIGNSAFYYCSSLANISIPDSVASIGRNAFYKTAYYNDDTNWQDGVLYIGNRIIVVKDDITECEIREGTVAIANQAFYGCRSLTSVVIPTVTTIGDYAFSCCSNLKKVEFTGNVDEIGEGAFQYCISLEDIVGLEYVEKIGMGAFFDCTSLNGKLVFENNEVEIGAYGLGYSLFDYIADVKAIAEHLAQNRHSMGEEYSCDSGECYSMYSMKEIEVPDNASDLTEEELVYEILKQGRDDEYTIYGYRGSTAEKYAEEYGITFIALGCYIHDYGDEEVIVAPTYTTTGRKGQRCKYCTDEINVVEIPCLEIEDSEEMEDNDTGVSVIFPDGAFADENVKIEVTPVTDDDAYKLISHKQGNYKVTMFDIVITADGEKVQPNGTVLVKIPLPRGYNQNKCVVYYVADDGTMEELKTYHYKDGYVYFETNHFSYYAIVEDVAEEEATDFLSLIKSFFESIKTFFENFITILKNFLGIVA